MESLERTPPSSSIQTWGGRSLNDSTNFAPSVLFEDDTKLNPYAGGDGEYGAACPSLPDEWLWVHHEES